MEDEARLPRSASKTSRISTNTSTTYGVKRAREEPVAVSPRTVGRAKARKLELALKEFGEKDTLEYRVQAMTDEKQTLSLWHDLPLMNDEFPGCVNYINEIPKWTRKKYSGICGTG